MADRTISIDIIANDYASKVFRNIGHGVSGFASATYNGIEKANRSLRSYNNAMRGFNSVMVGALKTAGRAVYDFTTDSIRQFAELEKQHAKTMGVLSAGYDFNWNGNNTPEQQANMQQFYRDSAALKEQAYKMGSIGPTGKGSLYSPDEISAAQLSLARAGITSDQMLNTDLVDTVIKFAGGNDISVDSAVAFGVQLGAQFHKKPEEWGEMFDQVTNAANMAPIDVGDVMSSLKYAGNMAAGYDVPLSDVLSAIVIMGNSGLKGSQAGSGISAIFSRGMSPTGITSASKAPTAHVEDVYNDFKSKVTDDDGMFLGLGNFTDELQVAMDGLTDVELAWFNKKMFGMYQQKAALALGRSGSDTDKTFDAISTAIAENSEGINDALYDLILESSGGQIEALQNVWDTTKMRFGDALSPMTKEVTKQLIQGLTTGEFKIDAESLQLALDQTVEKVNEWFGEGIGSIVENLGEFAIDGTQIGAAELPLVTGYPEVLAKLFTGDIGGAWEAFQGNLDATNEQIEKLPPELQETAKNLRDLIVLFEGLFALNIVTNVAEMITSLAVLVGGFGGMLWKGISGIFGKFNASVNTTVTSPNTVVNANYAGVNAGQIGNATFGMISNVASFVAKTTTMTVTATSVIVNGGSVTGGGGNPKGPTLVDTNGNPLTSFGNGMAQGAGFSIGAGGTAVGGLYLGGKVMQNMLTGAAGSAGALGTGSAPLALPAASSAAGAAGAAGASTAGAAGASNVLGIAMKTLGIAGSVGMLLSLSGSTPDQDKQFAEYYNEGVKDGLAGAELRDYVMQRAYDTGYHNLPEDEINIYKDTSRQNAAGFWFDEQMVTMAALNNQDALGAIYEQLVNQAQHGTIDENFLSGLSVMLTDMYKDELPTGGRIIIDQSTMSSILNTLFDDEYKKSGGYFGTFADQSINEFVKKNMGNAATGWQTNGTFGQWMAALTGKLDGYQYVDGTNNVYRNTTTGEQYQLTDDGALVALNGATANMQASAQDIAIAASQMDSSARELARQMITSGAVNVLDLGRGPLSTEGAIDYLTSQMTGNSGKTNKSGLGLGGKNGFMLPGIMSGKDMMNRFMSDMSGNADSGAGLAQTNATLDSIYAEMGQISADAAKNITSEDLRAAFLEGMNNPENALNTAATAIQTTSISISDAVKKLSETPSWVMSLGQGPISSEGAYNYVMGQLANGQSANQQLLQNIQNGITNLDPSLTVDITNKAPIVNVDVNVKVDKSGNVTKQVIQGFGNIDNWLFKSSQRFGTTTRIER